MQKQTEYHEYVANRAPMDSEKQKCLTCGESPQEGRHHPPAPKDLTTRLEQEVEEKKSFSEGAPWNGESPFFLVFERGPSDNVGIDIDTGGWIESFKELFRTPGVWLLMHKGQGRPVMAVVLEEGEQFYFVKHHVGNLMAGSEVLLYGMGKKQADGNKVNLWLLPNGMTVGGPEGDADLLASRMLGPQQRP